MSILSMVLCQVMWKSSFALSMNGSSGHASSAASVEMSDKPGACGTSYLRKVQVKAGYWNEVYPGLSWNNLLTDKQDCRNWRRQK